MLAIALTFLGFSIANDGSERRTASKALDKFKTRIRELTRRTRGLSLPELIKGLQPYVIGWRSYLPIERTRYRGRPHGWDEAG